MTTDEERLAGHRDRMRSRGFDPDTSEYETDLLFSLDDAKDSLFDSTRSEPVPVFITREPDDTDRIGVVIDTIKANYNPSQNGLVEYPDWYFEGWVVPSGFTPHTVFKRIRMYVGTLGENEFAPSDLLLWQWIDEPAKVTIPIDASIRKLHPHGRTMTLLRIRGIKTIGDLLEFAKRHDFSEITSFGPGLLADLVKKLADAGYDTSDFTFRR